MNIYVQVQRINKDEKYNFGDDGIHESKFDISEKGKLYQLLVSEYGRCLGRVYVGDDSPKHIGWTFVKREKYDDSDKTFLAETWVTLFSKLPTVNVEYHYLK